MRMRYADFEREALRLYGTGKNRISFRLVMDGLRTLGFFVHNNVGPSWVRRFRKDHPSLRSLFRTKRRSRVSYREAA